MSYTTIKNLFDDKYSNFIETFENLSKSSNGKCLVKNKGCAYNLDKIFQSDCNSLNFKSVDCVKVFDDRIIFIEFKSGFVDEVTKSTFDYNTYFKECECSLMENFGNHCDALEKENINGYNRLFDLRKTKKLNLLLRLFSKFYETLFYFKSYIYPNCIQKRENIKIVYLVVVDNKYLKNKITTPEKLENGKIITPQNNELIEGHLQKLCKINDGKVLCDIVKVSDSDEFDLIVKSNFIFND